MHLEELAWFHGATVIVELNRAHHLAGMLLFRLTPVIVLKSTPTDQQLHVCPFLLTEAGSCPATDTLPSTYVCCFGSEQLHQYVNTIRDIPNPFHLNTVFNRFQQAPITLLSDNRSGTRWKDVPEMRDPHFKITHTRLSHTTFQLPHHVYLVHKQQLTS